ncbi:MAG: bifunctional heptose 7-phosphate kinase/heptose 1-phosphate adenyltransferase [candidate division WOR-3 bacterium]
MSIEKALERFSGFRVGVIGDLILDRYLFGDAERISPEAPVPVVRTQDQRDGPGGAGNVATNLLASGAKVFLFGIVGDDAEGRALVSLLDEIGISNRVLVDPTRPTTLKTRVIAQNQQVIRIDREVCSEITTDLAEELAHAVAEAPLDALIIEDYDKGTMTPWLIESVKEIMADRLVSVDPKSTRFRQYSGVGLFKPNRREFLSETRTRDDLASIAKAAAKFRRETETERLLVTLGGDGAIACDNGGTTHVPALRREVYDVTGAGDTVIAYATLGLLAGLSFVESACIASIAGGIKVGKFGATPVSLAEVAAVVRAEWDNLLTKTRELP